MVEKFRCNHVHLFQKENIKISEKIRQERNDYYEN